MVVGVCKNILSSWAQTEFLYFKQVCYICIIPVTFEAYRPILSIGKRTNKKFIVIDMKDIKECAVLVKNACTEK